MVDTNPELWCLSDPKYMVGIENMSVQAIWHNGIVIWSKVIGILVYVIWRTILKNLPALKGICF